MSFSRSWLRREILVDYRPGAGIRYSPHFYTTDDEIRHAVDQTREILDSGAYRAHLQAGPAYYTGRFLPEQQIAEKV